MASVFLSYDHDDALRAEPIASALEAHGHSVWWDRQIHGGAEFNDAIETAVQTSDAVVVLWSENSVRSPWVRDEAGEGRDRGRLVPVAIDAVKPPMGFRQYQTIDLAGWKGGRRIPRLPDLLDAIEKVTSTVPQLATATKAPATRARQGRRAGNSLLSRRVLLGGAAAAGVAALAGGGIWWSARPEKEDPRFQPLLYRAFEQMLKGTADENTAKLLEEATAMQPDSPKAWGLLALLRSYLASGSDGKDSARLVDRAEEAARQALVLNPKQPDALLAMFELQGSTLSWTARDQKLRQIIAIDPNHVSVMIELALLTAATGMLRESWAWNERALAIEPLNSDLLGRRALKLWIWGRIPESDKVIDQLRGLYPDDPWAWFVRTQLYAFTGRAGAALALLDNEPMAHGHSPMARLWRASLPALENRSPERVATAKAAAIHVVRESAMAANEAILIMSALGELDTAFDIADGTLLSRGPLIPPDNGRVSEDAGWRIATQWMWVPPVAAMRADPRFLALCQGVGLTDYWQQRGVKPDLMGAKA